MYILNISSAIEKMIFFWSYDILFKYDQRSYSKTIVDELDVLMKTVIIQLNIRKNWFIMICNQLLENPNIIDSKLVFIGHPKASRKL